jgi:alpha-L-fucosidase
MIRLFVIVIVIYLLFFCQQENFVNQKIEQTGEISKEQRLEWFKEAKFGMFIHWGPYSNLAGEWQGKNVPVGENAEWIMQKLKIPVVEYRDLSRQFNPIYFNAEDWVQLAKSTGMKYMVITSKHHDGFAMYHSKVSQYNVLDWTPFDRDPLKELKRECMKAGIKFCIYYSHREDWDESYAYGNTWDFDFDPKKNLELFEQKYLETKAKPQLRELLENYGPFGLIWFDRGIYTQKQAQDFVQLVHSIQPDCIINGRVGNYNKELMGDYQNLNDNGMPVGGIEEYWETPQTLNETWGYSKFDKRWKNPQTIIHRLAEIVSKGGNYLLNIGPKGDGTIPKVSVDILKEVGRWVQRNGESIYGTSASPFAETPWGACTTRDNKLYLHILRWPEEGMLLINGIKNDILAAYFLLEESNKLSIQKRGDQIKIDLPQKPLDQHNTVIVLELEGVPEVEPSLVKQKEDGSFLLDNMKAITIGKTVKRFNRRGKFHISKWTAREDQIKWFVEINQPGNYKISITYAANPKWADQKYQLNSGSQSITTTVQPTGDWYEYKTFKIGILKFENPGKHEIKIQPANTLQNYLMYFKEMVLVPE